MIVWEAAVEYDTSDQVQAPTALTMTVPELSYSRTVDGTGLRLVFPVTASSLDAATTAALRLAGEAMSAADMTGRPMSLHVTPIAGPEPPPRLYRLPAAR